MDKELLKTGDKEIDGATKMQFEKGYLWEVALSRAFAEKEVPIYRVPEIKLDGIAMSPDGVQTIFDYSHEKVVEEYKCTSASSSKSPADNWKWIMQVKGYCKAVGALKCIFRVFHIRDFVPVYNVWELVFTQAELDENWEAILNHAKTMEKGMGHTL